MRGEGSTEGSKQQWRDNKRTLESWSEEHIQNIAAEGRITSKQAKEWIIIRNWTDERFEQQLDEWYPTGQIYRQPEFWDDTRFNSPSLPVVGVTWFEARAYSRWLSTQTGQVYSLPSEAHFEAAARGRDGREYPYGSPFDGTRSNTFESHIRRTTPVGMFDNATPEGAFDLTGNAYTWTTSIYDQEAFPYPYNAEDGREHLSSAAGRVLRGGSWSGSLNFARAVARGRLSPFSRNYGYGFRLLRAPSQKR